MRGFPFELLLALLFAAFLLFNYVMQQAARRRQAEAAQQALEEDDEIPEEEWRGTAATPRTHATSVLVPPVPSMPPMPPWRQTDTLVGMPLARRRRRFARQRLLGTRRQVQDAFVAATILGPCRADQPYDLR